MDKYEFLDILEKTDMDMIGTDTTEIAGVKVSIYEDIDRVDDGSSCGGTQTYYLTAEEIDGGSFKCEGFIELSYESWVDTNWLGWQLDE